MFFYVLNIVETPSFTWNTFIWCFDKLLAFDIVAACAYLSIRPPDICTFTYQT